MQNIGTKSTKKNLQFFCRLKSSHAVRNTFRTVMLPKTIHFMVLLHIPWMWNSSNHSKACFRCYPTFCRNIHGECKRSTALLILLTIIKNIWRPLGNIVLTNIWIQFVVSLKHQHGDQINLNLILLRCLCQIRILNTNFDQVCIDLDQIGKSVPTPICSSLLMGKGSSQFPKGRTIYKIKIFPQRYSNCGAHGIQQSSSKNMCSIGELG